jgi:hypothetical protein
MENLQLAKNYFHLFNLHSLSGLKNLFLSDITLIDWTNKWIGIEDVLNANSHLFSLGIRVEINELNCINDKVYCHILVYIGEVVIKVLDVITIENNLIKKIEAYKG